MALKKINNQYTNTDNIVKTYSVGGRYFVAFKGGIEIELKGANAATEYATLSAYFDKTRTGEYVNKNIIYKTYQVGTSPNYKYFLEFTNGQKIEIQANEYNAIISDGGESPIDPQSLDNSIATGIGISGDVSESLNKYEIHLDMTGAAAGKVLKVDSTGEDVEWGTAGGGTSDLFTSETEVSGESVDFAELGSDNQWHLSGFTVCDSSLKIDGNSIIIPGIENIKTESGGTTIPLFWHGTKSQYDALETKGNGSLYIATDTDYNYIYLGTTLISKYTNA